MTSQEFEQELQQLHKGFTIVDNPTRPGLSNIFFNGVNYDLPVVSTNDIRDEVDPSYMYEFPNGFRARFWSKPEVMGRIEIFLRQIKDGSIQKNYEE